MAMAVPEAVRVAHIRGSGGDSRRLAYASDCRLLQWLTLLGCTADLAGAAPSLKLGTSQVLSTNFWLVAAPVAPDK